MDDDKILKTGSGGNEDSSSSSDDEMRVRTVTTEMEYLADD